MILLIEFEPVTLIETAAALEAEGYKVVSAPATADAVAAFDLYAERLHAVVIGGALRSNGRGLDVARKIRERAPIMPIVYVSGLDAAEWPHAWVSRSKVLKKPITSQQLITVLRDITV